MWNSSENKIEIILIRHGATKNNIEKRYCGSKNDDELLDAAVNLIRDNAEKGIYPDVEIVYASPKKRALQTAGIIYPKEKPIIIDEFDEIDFGDFEGKNYDELKDNPDYQKWIESNGEMTFPNGDAKAEYCERVKAGFEKMAASVAKQGNKRVGIVAHGGTIMALLSVYAGDNYYDFMVHTGEGYICEYDLNSRSIKIIEKIQ